MKKRMQRKSSELKNMNVTSIFSW